MYPVFGCVANEVLLTSTRCTVALNRHSPRTNEVVKFRELDNEGIVVVLKEWLGFQSCSKNGLEVPARLFL